MTLSCIYTNRVGRDQILSFSSLLYLRSSENREFMALNKIVRMKKKNFYINWNGLHLLMIFHLARIMSCAQRTSKSIRFLIYVFRRMFMREVSSYSNRGRWKIIARIFSLFNSLIPTSWLNKVFMFLYPALYVVCV